MADQRGFFLNLQVIAINCEIIEGVTIGSGGGPKARILQVRLVPAEPNELDDLFDKGHQLLRICVADVAVVDKRLQV